MFRTHPNRVVGRTEFKSETCQSLPGWACNTRYFILQAIPYNVSVFPFATGVVIKALLLSFLACVAEPAVRL